MRPRPRARLPRRRAARNRRGMFGLANPDRFLRFTRPLTPAVWVLAAVLLAEARWKS